MSSQYTTNYDDFQSTISSAYGEGGPWACRVDFHCSISTHRHIDSTATEYLAFEGTLSAMLQVRPELGRPGRRMAYTWQYSACLGAANISPGLYTGVQSNSTHSLLSVCPDVGEPKTETGEFTIANDGTFSMWLTLSYGEATAYLTGMKFSMSPKESSGESQVTSPSNTPQSTVPPGAMVATSSVGSTFPRSVGSTGASTNANSTSTNPESRIPVSSDLSLSTTGSIVGGMSQNTQGPVVGPSVGQSRASSAVVPIIVGSIIGAISAISIAVIIVLFFRQRSRDGKQAKVAPNSTIRPFGGENNL